MAVEPSDDVPTTDNATGVVRVVIELNASADPIEGSLWTVDGGTVRFGGWIGLVQALTAARSAATPEVVL